MAISANPMTEEDRKIRIALAKATRDDQRLRGIIERSGDTKAIERVKTLDRAVERGERIVQSRLDRTRAQRTQAEIAADERKTQPQPEPRPWYESGNRRSAFGMSAAERQTSEQRAHHNIDVRDGKAMQDARATLQALRTAKLEATAQAVERDARNRDGPISDRQARIHAKARFNTMAREQQPRERERE